MIATGWLLVLLTVLAVARLTRLVTEDVIFQPFRRFVIRHRPAPPAELKLPDAPEQDAPRDEDWLVYLVHCRWCSSVWIAAAVTPVVYNWPTVWWVQIPLLALAASLVAGLAAGLER